MTRRKRTVLIGIATVVVIGGPVAWFSGLDDAFGPGTPSHSMTLDAAKQRVRDNLAGAIAALPVKPELSPPQGSAAGGACSEGLENDLTGQYDSSLQYQLVGIPTERNDDVLEAVRSYATQHGFGPFAKTKNAESFKDADGFTLGVSFTFDASKTPTISAASPCVWPTGKRP